MMMMMLMIHVSQQQLVIMNVTNSDDHLIESDQINNSLPLDLLFTICEYLDLVDQGNLRLVCRLWNHSLTGDIYSSEESLCCNDDLQSESDVENDNETTTTSSDENEYEDTTNEDNNLLKMFLITQMKTLLRIQRSKCQMGSRRWNSLTRQIEKLQNRRGQCGNIGMGMERSLIERCAARKNVWHLSTDALKQKIKRLHTNIRFKYFLSPVLFPEIQVYFASMKTMNIPEFTAFEGVEQYDHMISKFNEYAMNLISTSNHLLELLTAFGESIGVRRSAKRFTSSIFREITERYALLKQAMYRSIPYDWLMKNESYQSIEIAMRESFIKLVHIWIKCDWRCRAMSMMHRITHCLIAMNDVQVMQLCRDYGLLKAVLFFKNSERYVFSDELLQFMLYDPSTFEFYIDYPISEHNCLSTIQTFVTHWGKCYVSDDLLSRIIIHKRPSMDQLELTSWVLSNLHCQDPSDKLEIKYLLMSCRSESCDARMVELLLSFGKWSKKDLTTVLIILINCIAGLPSLRYLVEKIDVLIKHGADVNAKWDRVGFDGARISTNPQLKQKNLLGALGVEVRDGCRWEAREWSIIFDIVKLLIESGIDLNNSYEQVVQIWSVSIIDNLCPLQYIRPIFQYFKQCRKAMHIPPVGSKEYSTARRLNTLRERVSKVA